ncbi:hypothetical protein RHMOL_Rhmol07G0096100 [Rhododendron molle]|uniref:Uncharacterized protein n=1 Tax=Rhododendron molle TaxID=49168 RepID=A0ACC0N0B1_RHOML|nr:hypothetical protein RHMOL_Rhmol07G0096100 [Rhododendron molle]
MSRLQSLKRNHACPFSLARSLFSSTRSRSQERRNKSTQKKYVLLKTGHRRKRSMSYSAEMLETVKYMIGSIGPSGYGSKSTAEQVTECCADLSSVTAIITGHFLLTKLLLKKMTETARATGVQGRIVNVSSSIHGWFSGDVIRDLGMITRNKCGYDATRAYALSKLANVLHTKELAQRLKEMEANVTVNCVHPGIVRTRLTRDREGFITDLVFFLASKLLKRIPQAAATSCYVATHPRLLNVSGKYFADCNEASTSKLGSNSFEAARLWSASELMVSRYSEAVFD